MSNGADRKLVLVNMSDRPESNSGRVLTYLQHALELTVKDLHLIFDRMNLREEMSSTSCRGCAECYRDVTAHNDEFPRLYSRILESDLLVAASPTRYGSTTPLGNILINRSDPYFGRDAKGGFADKKAIGIVTAGSTVDRAKHTLGCLEHWFNGHHMRIVEGAVIVGASEFRDDHFPETLPEDMKEKIDECAARIASLLIKK